MPQNAGRCALPALLVFSLLPNWQHHGAKVFSSGNSRRPAGAWRAALVIDKCLNGLILTLASLTLTTMRRCNAAWLHGLSTLQGGV